MHLIRALAAQREGDVPAAVATLDRVLRAAAASRNWRPFLTVPRAELDELVDRTPGAGDLLATTPLVGAPSLYPDAVVIVELSEREQHVLSELAKGRSLTEIAKAAVLSDNTIRSQRRSLYRKLGTSDRGTAIARARQWGLLAADG
jgi:LuxR family maltose regulon positive regulatory protein